MAPVTFEGDYPKSPSPNWYYQPPPYAPNTATAWGREQLMRPDGPLDETYRGPSEPGEEKTERAMADDEARRALAGGLPDAPGEAIAVQGGKPFKF